MRIYSDHYFAVAIYRDTEFVGTFGGSYEIADGMLTEVIEFDTQQRERVGTRQRGRVRQEDGSATLELTMDAGPVTYQRIDAGAPGKLAGAWLITGRYTDGEMKKTTPGARRTMKILSGTRFQWIAYNVDTHEFFGTGGGTYTTADGKYTETIDFFSRDQTRVGKSLEFDFSTTSEGDWRHRGKSSKGDPIDEIWSKREKIKI